MIVTWILALATFGVLTSIAVACRRAHLEAKAQLCDGLPVADRCAVVTGGPPIISLVKGGEHGEPAESDAAVEVSPPEARRHLRLVGA